MRAAPRLLIRLGFETLHGLPPFRVDLRDLSQLDGCGKPAGFDPLEIGALRRFVARRICAKPPLRAPGVQTPDELGHACADERVLQPPSFKPEAGGGEV